MPVDRMRMRPWLEKMIESNSVSGLVWIDKNEKTFSIPWKHGARQGWRVDKDASLFKLWAVHTKKYTEGKTDADPRTWKANFRCALRSLPDVTEVKNKSVQKGEEAVRVFKMLHVIKKPKEKRTKTKDAKRCSKRTKVEAEEMDHNDSKSPADEHVQLHGDTAALQADTIDSTGTQDTELRSTDVMYVSNSEVPECASTVEIGPEGNGFYTNFQISPEHSTEYCDSIEEDIIQIAQQFEQDNPWGPNSADDHMVLDTTYSTSSPGSQWSDSSSDEIEVKLYTNLTPELLTVTEELFCTNFKEN